VLKKEKIKNKEEEEDLIRFGCMDGMAERGWRGERER